MSSKNQRSGNPVAALIKTKIFPFLSTLFFISISYDSPFKAAIPGERVLLDPLPLSVLRQLPLCVGHGLVLLLSHLLTHHLKETVAWDLYQSIVYTANEGPWESNINVWFPFMHSQKWNCYFQNRIIMLCLPQCLHSYISVRDLYISKDRSSYSSAGRYVCGPILGIYI